MDPTAFDDDKDMTFLKTLPGRATMAKSSESDQYTVQQYLSAYGSVDDNTVVLGRGSVVTSYGVEDDDVQKSGASSSSDEETNDRVLPAAAHEEAIRLTCRALGPEQVSNAIQQSSEGGLLPLRMELKRHLFQCVPADYRTSQAEDWQARMAQAELVSDAAERSARIYEITRDFMQTASMYGQVIISERVLPVARKSIKPVNLGGVAGGEKYIVQGILFKFSQDVELSPGMFMYGGDRRDDDAAHKASGHELKALETLMSRVDGRVLRVPLMTLVDFRGCRLSAQSLLPLGGIVYGSANAGKTIFNEEDCLQTGASPLVMEKVLELGRDLNLAPHRVTELSTGKIKTLLFPLDIEIHKSRTEKDVAFVIDTARLMPPVAPLSNASKRDIFYKLFRPEFVCMYPKPLSPDAFSLFGMLDKDAHHEVIREATTYLFNELIPTVAASITKEDMKNVTRFIQQNGVNARFLGRVRDQLTDEDLRCTLSTEMIARVLFKRIKGLWRAESSLGVLPLLQIVVTVFNEVIAEKSDKSIRDGLARLFGAPHTDESLCSRLALPRAAELAGVIVESNALSTGELLSISDLSLKPKVKELGFSAVAESDALFREAKGRSSQQRALILLQRAASILRREIVSRPLSMELKTRLCRVLLWIAKRSIGVSDKEWDGVSSEVGVELGRLPLSLPERFLMQCQLHRCRVLRDLSRLNIASAFASWRDAVDAIFKVDVNGKWHLKSDAVAAYKTLDRLKNKLLNQDFLKLILNIWGTLDYTAAVKALAGLEERPSCFMQSLVDCEAHWQLPKLAGLAIEIGCHGSWLEKQREVVIENLTHCPIDETFLKKLCTVSVPSLQSLKLSLCLSPTLLPLRSWVTNLSELTIDKSPGPSFEALADLICACSSLSRLALKNLGGRVTQRVWSVLPWKTLTALDLTGNPMLLAPAEPISGADALISLTTESCGNFSLTAVLLGSFPKLQRLYCDDLLPEVASALPFARTLRVLHVSRGTLKGIELPDSLPELSDVWLGTQVTDEGFDHLTRAAPNIARLNLRRCNLTNEATRGSLSRLSHLTHLDVRACGTLADDYVVGAIKSSGARIQAWKSSGTYALTSAQVVTVLNLDQFRVLEFFSPRDVLLLSLRPGLTSLTLGSCQTISPQAWEAIATASPQLKLLSFSQLGNVTDDWMIKILSVALAIDEIVLSACPLLTGQGLAVASQRNRLTKLKRLTIQNCCPSEQDLCVTLAGTSSLESLILEASGECNEAIRILALHCKGLRRISIASPAKRYSLTDPDGWLVKVGSLREFESLHMEKFAIDFIKGASSLGQLETVIVTNLFKMPDEVIESLVRCPSVQNLLTERVALSLVHIAMIANSTLPLVMFQVHLEQFHDEAFNTLSKMPFLRFVSMKGANSSGSSSELSKVAQTPWVQSLTPVERSFLIMERERTKWVEPGLIELLRADRPESGRQIALQGLLRTTPSPAIRSKWCYLTWCANDYSFRLMMQLAMQGYHVIVGVPEDTDEEELWSVKGKGEDSKELTKACIEQLTSGPYGFHFVPVSQKSCGDKTFLERVRPITNRLDLVLAWYCIDANSKNGILSNTGNLFKQNSFEGFSRYFLHTAQAFMVSQINLVVSLEPILRASPGCKVLFHSNPIGSVTEASTATGYSFRTAFSGVKMLVKVLSLEIPSCIFVGAHLGVFFPLYMDQQLGGMATSVEVATRTTQLVGRLEMHHSGKVWRHTLEQIPP